MRSLNKNLFLTAILMAAAVLAACQKSMPVDDLPETKTIPPLTTTATLAPTLTETPTLTSTPTETPTPTLAVITIPAGQVEAPILLYHHISDDSDKQDSRYNVTPAKFDEQMQWLHDNGYQTITVTQLANLIFHGGEIPQRPVVITFDDGNLDNFNKAYPILQKYGYVATFYVVESYINGEGMVSTDQLKQLIASGWEIGSHSRTHAHLTAADTDLASEIRDSKLNLEERLGVKIYSFSYPFGEVSDEVFRLASSYGYTSAVGLSESTLHGMNTIFYLSRIEIQNDYSLEKFAEFFPWGGPLQ